MEQNKTIKDFFQILMCELCKMAPVVFKKNAAIEINITLL